MNKVDVSLIPDEEKNEYFLDLCVSSLRRGHANLLCIVPILTDVPKDTSFRNTKA